MASYICSFTCCVKKKEETASQSSLKTAVKVRAPQIRSINIREVRSDPSRLVQFMQKDEGKA